MRWWHEVGGEAVSFGSDAHVLSAVAHVLSAVAHVLSAVAHVLSAVAHDFTEAAAMVEAQGFVPGRDPHDFWRRRA